MPCASTTERPGPGGIGRPIRNTPDPAQPASSTADASTARRPTAALAPTITVSSVSPCTPIADAGWIITSPNRPGHSHTLPSGFQGNPVSTSPRTRSDTVHHPASAARRRQPRAASRASPTGTAVKSASPTAVNGVATGTSHQNSSALTRIAFVSQ